MKKVLLLAGISALFLQGCMSVHVEKEPTLNSIKWSVDSKKVYLRTLYVQSDFNVKGEKRTFKDYDFRTETAPCTVVQQYSPRTNIYTIKSNSDKLSFECRPYFGNETPDHRRLYLLGSSIDCEDRQWDYHAPFINSLENVLGMCENKKPTSNEKEKIYEQWKNS